MTHKTDLDGGFNLIMEDTDAAVLSKATASGHQNWLLESFHAHQKELCARLVPSMVFSMREAHPFEPTYAIIRPWMLQVNAVILLSRISGDDCRVSVVT